MYVLSHFLNFKIINNLHQHPILLYENALQKAFSAPKGAQFFFEKTDRALPSSKNHV
jgi:hypothetical protein